jgi:hypothetical protein
MPTLLDDGPALTGGVVDPPSAAVELQALEIVEVVVAGIPDVIPIMPPPSNVDVEPALPEPDIATEEHAALPDGPSIVGLRPPGLSSTEPIGMPTGPTAESGEAIPIAGVAGAPTCAWLDPRWRSAAIATAIDRRTIVSLCPFRMGVHRGFECPGTTRGIPIPAGRGVILLRWTAHSSTQATRPLTCRFEGQGR